MPQWGRQRELIRAVQRAVKASPDGKWGPRTERAIDLIMDSYHGYDILDAIMHSKDGANDPEVKVTDDQPETGPYPPWLEWQLKHVGEKEVVGYGNNPFITGLWDKIGITWTHTKDIDSKVPWCAALQCAALEHCGIESPRNGMARSFCNWGHPVGLVPGAIVVFPRGKYPSGHVACVVKKLDRMWVQTCDGNVSDRVKLCKRRIKDIIACHAPKGWVEYNGILVEG